MLVTIGTAPNGQTANGVDIQVPNQLVQLYFANQNAIPPATARIIFMSR